jgi:hypothetical protein
MRFAPEEPASERRSENAMAAPVSEKMGGRRFSSMQKVRLSLAGIGGWEEWTSTD